MESSLINKPMRKTSSSNLLPMARRDLGSKGGKINLLANHFRVGLNINDSYFYHYNVCSSHSLHISCVCACEKHSYSWFLTS
jgi:hypothetical protein